MKFIKNIQESANELNSGMGKAWHKLWGGPSNPFNQGSCNGGFVSSSIILSTYSAIHYYTSVAPAYTSIELLANEFAAIKPVVKIDGEVSENHPLNELLARPNGDLTYTEFAKQLAAWFLISGNSFMSVSAMGEDKPPVEIEIVQPQIVDATLSIVDRYINSYRVSQGLFYQREESGRTFRFFDKEKEHELWHVKTFNPNINDPFGLSKLNAIFYENEQYSESSVHNLSMLRNGIRSSGVISTESNLTPEQRDDIRAELRQKNVGSGNAGSTFFFDGGKFDFKEMSKTMKDMDFKDLKEGNAVTIFNAFNIPLPMFVSKNMTLSNYAEAKLALHQNGVIPLADRLFQELTACLSPRYKDDPVISFDQSSIPALKAVENIEKERVRKANILTPNESRALDGYGPVENGNILYQPNNLVPLGTEDVTDEEAKNKFVNCMLGQKKYTDSQIEEYWNDSKD